MTRREFLAVSGILGLSAPVPGLISACAGARLSAAQAGRVTIIGAGAAGLATGYLLQQQGIDFQILEAAAGFGGRMKRADNFVGFPVPLGAEWIHVNERILNEILNDESISTEIPTTRYDPKIDYALYEGQRVTLKDIGFNVESKFIGSTWYDFFADYIVPSIAEKIRYNTVVESIDYTENRIKVASRTRVYPCDRVVVTVPVKMLQQGAIEFSPALPGDKQAAIEQVRVWDGCKAFIQFRQPFYPTAIAFEVTPETDGQKLYYDAAYGQTSGEHVLGLFAVGSPTRRYVERDDRELINTILNELDALFDGQASRHYMQHIFHNWNQEPYINGAYVVNHENWRRVRELGQRVGEQVYFAGCAYTDGRDWSSVHAAARSARRAVDQLTRG